MHEHWTIFLQTKAKFRHRAFTAPMSKLAHSLSTVPELGAVKLSVRNGKSAVQCRQRANATLITDFNRNIIFSNVG